MSLSATAIRPRTTPDFDRLSLIYRWMEWFTFGPLLSRCRCAFLDRLNQHQRALILGDGDGRFTARLLTYNPAVLIDAVDASPAMLSELLRRARPHRSRVQIHAADIRAWEPPGRAYDLVVTHFFLDCLTTDEVASLAAQIRSRVCPNAAWVVSEFALPANRFGRFIARPLIRLLYRAFGVLTGLGIRALPDHRKALSQSGFILKHRQKRLGGLLVSEWWQPAPLHPNDPHPPPHPGIPSFMSTRAQFTAFGELAPNRPRTLHNPLRRERILTSIIKPLRILCVMYVAFVSVPVAHAASPQPPGKMVDLGGHKLHIDCTGRGTPVVVVETGLGDFSFDWTLVQTRVSQFTRICTYDRAGYAWSDPGPKPRTFAQINLELHDALQKLGERGPFVLVGHSYGGPVVRNFAAVYPRDVAAMVFVDSAVEGMRVGIGPKQTIQLGVNVKPRDIPAPRETLTDSDRPQAPTADRPQPPNELDPLYKSLPPAQQKLHLWAQSLPGVDDAENSQREWSEQYFALWLADPGRTSLGNLPLVVLTREKGGYEDADVPATQLEQERKEGQSRLAHLSANSRQIMVPSGHNMNLEDPAAVSNAIHLAVEAVRKGQPLANQ